MSLARAFTTRRGKHNVLAAEADTLPHRSNTTKTSGFQSVRSKISGPIELVHTTNMLSYNAPDLFPLAASSTISSPKMDEDSLSDDTNTNQSTPPTSPDIGNLPKESPAHAKPNRLSQYLSPPGQAAPPANNNSSSTSKVSQRAPSYTNKLNDTPTRQGSVSRFSDQSHRSVSIKSSLLSFSRSSSSSTSTSVTSSPHISHHVLKMSYAGNAAPIRSSSSTGTVSIQRKDHSPVQSHSLGPELAQVTKIVDEFGVQDRRKSLDRDEREMKTKRLVKICADDYLREVQGLFHSFFTDVRPSMAAEVWI